ncbi:histone-lysine n-methyltransferase setmar-like protein [Trichonephila clavipes]|nr:histone-lysine n-methyltransferase setmar-like protein [Trichonephila clavipes]
MLIVHHEYAHTGQTINKEYYVEVLKRLRNAIRRKRPQLWESGDWLLHHDNAPAHTSNLVQQYLSKHSIAQLRQPPYSPDIAPLRLLAISSIENAA